MSSGFMCKNELFSLYKRQDSLADRTQNGVLLQKFSYDFEKITVSSLDLK
jgi:hypothetical protein